MRATTHIKTFTTLLSTVRGNVISAFTHRWRSRVMTIRATKTGSRSSSTVPKNEANTISKGGDMADNQRSDVGSMLASYRRNDHSKQCVVCGAGFQGMRKALYCGTTCKNRAYRSRIRLRLSQ